MTNQDAERAARFFDGFARDFDSLYEGKRGIVMRWIDARYRSDMFIRFALTFHAFWDISGKTVLDIGCGSGVYATEALRLGASHVTLIDGARGMLDLAQARVRQADQAGRCSFIQSIWPTAVERHDHAIVMGVMDYVSDPGTFLTAVRQSVRRSATISFPSAHWLRGPLRRMRYKARRVELTLFDGPGVERACLDAGFSAARIYKIPGAGQDFHVVAVV